MALIIEISFLQQRIAPFLLENILNKSQNVFLLTCNPTSLVTNIFLENMRNLSQIFRVFTRNFAYF